MAVKLKLGTSDSIVIVLSGSPATTQPTYICSYADTTGDTTLSSHGSTNSTTEVTMITAPSTGTRQVDVIGVFNEDTASVTVTVSIANGGTRTKVGTWTIPSGSSQDVLADTTAIASVNAITALTSDVTASGTGSVVATIVANAITNAKAAQMAANTIKGNNTGSTANASDLSVAQVTAMLNNFTSVLNGLVPASSGGTVNFLRADGSWSPVAGGMSYTTVADTAFTISTATDLYLAYSSITAARTVTLPAASSMTGHVIWIADHSGSVTATVKITATCAGSDHIEGSTITSIDLQTPYCRLGLISDGTKWLVLSRVRKVYRWHFDGALNTTAKMPFFSIPSAARIMSVQHFPQTAGTGTIILKVAGVDTYTITASSGDSTTAYTVDSTTQTAVAAGALVQARCSTGGTEADVTVEVIVDEWTV